MLHAPPLQNVHNMELSCATESALPNSFDKLVCQFRMKPKATKSTICCAYAKAWRCCCNDVSFACLIAEARPLSSADLCLVSASSLHTRIVMPIRDLFAIHINKIFANTRHSPKDLAYVQHRAKLHGRLQPSFISFGRIN
jgi:hypothetical protein